MKFKIVSDSSSNIFSFPGVSFASVALKINTASAEYVDDENIDGALVGGASLKEDSFIEMIDNLLE